MGGYCFILFFKLEWYNSFIKLSMTDLRENFEWDSKESKEREEKEERKR